MKIIILGCLLTFFPPFALTKQFVPIKEFAPNILVEARYFGEHNFIGRKIDGYKAGKCLLSLPAAKALAKAQKESNRLGYTLKTYDCYRPQMAVDHFVRWAKDLEDQKMKARFYPQVAKEVLFENGYIASKSGHSRGSTVDLTLVKLPAADQPDFNSEEPLVDCRSPERFKDNSVDMGTAYDCFDPLSHTENPEIGKKALKNRRLLKKIMQKSGFKNYSKEWWHYTLKNEPYPDTYFNFSIN